MLSAFGLFAPGLLSVVLAAAAPADLTGPWLFQPGDDPSWAEPAFDDRAWATVSVPTGWGRTTPVAAMAWYRRHVHVDPADVRDPPGTAVLLGKIDSAYELYAGGQRLGGVGALPPRPLMDYDRHGLYVIPPSAVGPGGEVVLALRVWKSPETESSVGGPVEGALLLGPTLELQRRALLSDLVQLLFGSLFLLVGLYHLQLYRRRTNLREYLWYALVALDAGLYLMLRTQWKYAFTDRFALLKELEYVALFALPALFAQFVWRLVGARITRAIRIHQAWCVGLAILVATPGLWLNTHVLPLWELSLLPLVGLTFYVLARESWRGNPEARTISAGLSVFMLFAIHDVAVDRGLMVGPRLTAFGFASFVLSMAICLANRFSRVQGELAALGRDLELRVIARTEELSRRTAEASAANRAKSQFLATMSHEIRTPLNAVIGMTGLVLDTPLAGEQRESIEIVRRSGEALLSLVNDILDFSKVESGRLELESQPFALRECLEEALEVVATPAAEKGLDLAYLADPDVPPLLRGDVTRVRQVLVNLVANAVKFTPAGGVLVTVHRQPEPATLRVTVADTGIGIPADRRSRLFQPFSQVDASHTREYGGTGLGLAISRRLCELMGGALWLEERTASGSTFHFTFQAAEEPAEVPKSLRAEQPYLRDRGVMVVGAGPLTRRMLEATLGGWGMTPRLVAADEPVLEVARRERPRVALIGFDAGGSGMLAAELLRGSAPATALPLIAFGPLAVREQMERAAELGMVARLVTPLRPAQLHAALLEAFGVEPMQQRPIELPPISRAVDDARPLRILVAEDNVINQKVALQMLQRLGYRADVAANGYEVLDALGRQAYDVVLLDVQMPEMDGLEAARRIRRQWEPGPRLIAMTANALQGDREACLAAGMDDYLSKPVARADLAAALRRCWSTPMPPRRTPMAASARAGPNPVLDLEPLTQLRQMEDASNPTFVTDLIENFLLEAPRRLESMQRALDSHDMESLERLAHSMKGSAGVLGGQRLAASCQVLEYAIHTEPGADMGRLVQGVHAEFAALADELAIAGRR